MNNIDKTYTDLLQDILDNGVEKKDRTGTGTISVFGRQIRHKMAEGFPLLTTKKMYWHGVVAELLWFLRGDTNIQYLVQNGCHIWDGDAYKNYEKTVKQSIDKATQEGILKNDNSEDYNYLSKELFIERIKTDDEFAKKWGSLGKIYGFQWRSWGSFKDRFEFTDNSKGMPIPAHTSWDGIDQIANLISELKTNPDSRRLLVSAWNVADVESGSMVLPPCHYGFQVYTRELSLKERTQYKKKRDCIARTFAPYTHQMLDGSNIPTRAISLMYNARSQDVPLGTPFNIASYALLLEIIAKMVNMVPDELITNMGDCHIYLNQIEGIKEQLTRDPYELPKLVHMKTDDFYKSLSEDLSLLSHLDPSDFKVEGYQSHPAIKIPLSN